MPWYGGLAEVAREGREHLVAIVPRVLGHEDDVERRAVVDEDLPVAVVDDPPGRGHAHEAHAVLLRHEPHLGPAVDLEVPQAHAEEAERQHDDAGRDAHPDLELRRDFARNDLQASGCHVT
jgi:hypothetical protein